MKADSTIAIVGLGYVGLPLAVAFGSRRATIGFDLNETKLSHYREGRDPSGEVAPEQLAAAQHLEFTSDPGATGGSGRHHRCGADTDRCGQTSRPESTGRRLPHGR